MLTTDIPLDTFWTKLCTKGQNADKDFTLKKMTLTELVELIGESKWKENLNILNVALSFSAVKGR